MKLKLSKTTLLSLFFIFLMLSSTVAYSFLQVFRPSENTIELPSSNIIDYELTPEQESYLLNQGKTIISYKYSLKCSDCLKEKTLLEQFTNLFSNQLLLKETIAENKDLTITSRNGQKSVYNITQETVFDALCELMTEQPIACVRRGI